MRHELTLDRFLGDTFLELTEDAMPDRILETLRAQGIDPAAAGLDREILAALVATRAGSEPARPVKQPVQPQAHRQARKARLNEQSRALAYKICIAGGLSPNGAKLASKGGTRAANDLQAVIVLVHKAVNDHLGISARNRRELTAAELESALSALESVGDAVQADIADRLA